MNKTSVILLLFLISCKDSKIEKHTQISGKELFTKNNCGSCHQLDQKIIGPSLIEISNIYQKNNASMVDFLRGESVPIIDESQYEIMKINLEITKTMTDDELKAIEDYMKNPTE